MVGQRKDATTDSIRTDRAGEVRGCGMDNVGMRPLSAASSKGGALLVSESPFQFASCLGIEVDDALEISVQIEI